jgi:hypothetical protein
MNKKMGWPWEASASASASPSSLVSNSFMENFKQHNKNLRYGRHVNDKFVIWLHAFH